MPIEKVGVLGCGLMGSGIAQVVATAGYPTVVKEVADDFHCRFDAKSKTYAYRIWNAEVMDVFRWETHAHVAKKLDVAPMSWLHHSGVRLFGCSRMAATQLGPPAAMLRIRYPEFAVFGSAATSRTVSPSSCRRHGH